MNQETAQTRPQPDSSVGNFRVLLPSAHVVPASPACSRWTRSGAATHGRLPGRSFRLTIQAVGAKLRIEVTDPRGHRLLAPRTPDAVAESGRGLLLVEAPADRWRVIEGRFPRKAVWAELGFTPPEPALSRSGAVGG